MVKIMDPPPKKMDDLGVPRFKETPIGSMYGIYTYMDGWFFMGFHVGKYTSPMDGMGITDHHFWVFP